MYEHFFRYEYEYEYEIRGVRKGKYEYEYEVRGRKKSSTKYEYEYEQFPKRPSLLITIYMNLNFSRI